MMDLSTATDELVRTIGAMPQELGASACFGTPVERDGHTLIPVARVSFGYGLGFGGGSGSNLTPSENGSTGGDTGEGGGGGGGGGGSSSPVAVIDVTSDGVTIQQIQDTTRIALASFALAAWGVFWLFLTIRTSAREHQKTRRHEIDKAAH
jgi:uncharacterized spore protein YtfJ